MKRIPAGSHWKSIKIRMVGESGSLIRINRELQAGILPLPVRQKATVGTEAMSSERLFHSNSLMHGAFYATLLAVVYSQEKKGRQQQKFLP